MQSGGSSLSSAVAGIQMPTSAYQQTTTTTGAYTSYNNTGGSSPVANFGADAYAKETRKVSSVVLESRVIGDMPQQEEVTYVEVPTIEEQVSYVTKREVREIEKRVPKYEIEYVEKVVEKPVYEYYDVPREVVQIEEVVREVPVPKIVDRPIERIVRKPVEKVRYVEQMREVPGPVVEVPKKYTVQREVEVYKEVDREVPVIVAQTIKPIITETNTQVPVDVLDYEPEVIPVDVHVAKPVASALQVVGQVGARHKLVNITSGQYNTILRMLNTHMDERSRQTLPFISESGRVPFVPDNEAHYIVAPADIVVDGWMMGQRTAAGNIRNKTGTHTGTGAHTMGTHSAYSTQNVANTVYGSTIPQVTTTTTVMRGVDDTGSIHTQSYSQMGARQGTYDMNQQTYDTASLRSGTVLSQRPVQSHRNRVCC